MLAQVCAFGAKKKAVSSSRLGSVKKQIKAVKYKIQVKESQRRTELGKLAIVQSRLEDAQDRLQIPTTSNSRTPRPTSNTTRKHLSMKKRELARHQELLRHRVVEIYQGDDLNYADVVLGSTNMWTFLSRTYYLQRIVNADTTLIDQISEEKKSIEDLKARQAQSVARSPLVKSNLSGSVMTFNPPPTEKVQQIHAIENDKASMERALAEMQAAEQDIEAQIRRCRALPKAK